MNINPAYVAEDITRCTGPANIPLNSVESVVDWINAMPKPLTLACFVASLPRPLKFNATNSRSSVQPAIGNINPRIFVQYDNLWLSFVPQEAFSAIKIPSPASANPCGMPTANNYWNLVWKWHQTCPSPIHKGELAFPILNTLPRNAAYAHIADTATESRCKACHGYETIVGQLDGAAIFRSKMLRSAKQTLLRPDDVFLQYLACDPNINTGPTSENHEWYRCQMLKAFVDRGPIEWQNFRSDIAPCIQE